MTRYASLLLASLAQLLLLGACVRETSRPTVIAAHAGAVDAQRLSRSGSEPGQWLTAGRDLQGTYHSPLHDINASNVSQLGYAWDYTLGSRRGLEATPLEVDGVLYFSGNFGRVYALDAVTGREKWVYDPQVDGQWGRYACCDAVNRGVAVWRGRVFVGSLDGYLHAIDAETGRRLWKIDTLLVRDPQHPYTLPGAPVIAGDAVIIGSAGADFAGVRGYVDAYDIDTGRRRWRFYTVPSDPAAGPQDQAHLAAALPTWDARHPWGAGSGGTVWDGISYDPTLQLIYFGTANGAPYNNKQGGSQGGDHLYTASILALHVDSGELAWSYQTTPGDHWDYDSTQKLVLADLVFGGVSRKVLMQANKNGFLYVLDRTTGEVLAAHSFAYANWTSGIDPLTHRPKPNARAEYADEPRLIFPGTAGAHSWQPMSFDPTSQHLFIPTIEQGMIFLDTSTRPTGFVESWFTVPAIVPEDYDPKGLQRLYGALPPLAVLAKGVEARTVSRGLLRAIDPVTGKLLWETPSQSDWDGGVLSTDGNLVMQGDSAGRLNFYAADSGSLLHSVDLGSTVMAAPMTYRIGTTQYVAVLAGYGGGNLGIAFPPDSAAYRYGNQGRLITLKLGGGAVPKPPEVTAQGFAKPPPNGGSSAQVAEGGILYNRYCARCHVFGRAVLPDLRRMSRATDRLFDDIVLHGIFATRGMARWDDVLSPDEVHAIHAFIIDSTWTAYSAQPVAR